MSRRAIRAAGYRWRATLAERRAGYLAVVLLLGAVGGIGLGSLSGARQTQSSFSTYLASTNPETLEVFDAYLDPSLGILHGFDPADGPKLAGLAGVAHARTVVGFDGNLDYVKGIRTGAAEPGSKPVTLEGAYGGEYEIQDRVSVVSGRMYDPGSADEAVMNAQAAREAGLRVGSVITVALNSDGQLISSASNPPPARVVRVRIVGIVVFNFQVVIDQYNQLGSATVDLSPALTRRLAGCCATYSYSAVQLMRGAAVGTVEHELTSALGPTAIDLGGFQTTAPQLEVAARALRPISAALGVFGGLALLAALVIVGQLVGRAVRRRADEADILRALGADPGTVALDLLLGVFAALVLGALLAGIVAVALSPLFPLGPVRPVTPVALHLDWTVLGFGVPALVLVLGLAALALTLALAPHRVAARAGRVGERPSAAARSAAAPGLPVTAVTGVRFALDPRSGRERVPVRSAILGSVLAVAVVVTAVTFGASLNTLISHPRLYGWDWDYTVLSGFAGDEDLPGHLTSSLLAHDPHVAATSGVYFVSTDIDAVHDVPTLGMAAGAAVQPPVLSGHGLSGRDQIVLGPQTLAALDKRIGETVTLTGRSGSHRTRLVIVGTATMPALDGPGLGVGAIIDYRHIPPKLRNLQENSLPGPNAYFVRAKGGPSPAALASLRAIDRRINATVGASDGQPAGGVIEVLRPTEITDAHSIEAIPAVLGAGLALGALAALAATLVASVRLRRRDLAVLKTLGFAGGQLATVVAWQATVALVLGGLLGAPIGIVLGRLLWKLFAQQIAAVPSPSVPVLVVAGIGIGAVVLGNLVAAIPGRLAARTSTSVLFRTE